MYNSSSNQSGAVRRPLPWLFPSKLNPVTEIKVILALAALMVFFLAYYSQAYHLQFVQLIGTTFHEFAHAGVGFLFSGDTSTIQINSDFSGHAEVVTDTDNARALVAAAGPLSGGVFSAIFLWGGITRKYNAVCQLVIATVFLLVAFSGTFTGELALFSKRTLLVLGVIFLLSALFTMSNALRSLMSFVMAFVLIFASWLNKGYLYGVGHNRFQSDGSDLSVLAENAQILTPIIWGHVILFFSIGLILFGLQSGFRAIKL